jgi:hypothetical protein
MTDHTVSHIGQTIVLRTSNMLIVDVDLLNNDEIIQKAENFYKLNSLNSRIYKTKNGHRIFITNKIIDFNKDKVFLYNCFYFFNGDLQYLDIKYSNDLLKNGCDARIIPKYKKFQNINEKKVIKNFLNYQKDNSIAVTRYMTSIGDGLILDDFKNFIAKHDKATKAFLKDSILV